MDFPAGFQEFGGLEKAMSKKNLTRKIPRKKEIGSKKSDFLTLTSHEKNPWYEN